MNVPPMYYVNAGFAWFLVLLALVGYFYILSKTGKKSVFWCIFAAAWIMFGTSHLLLLSGVSSNEWYMTLLRIAGYVLVVAAVSTLMMEQARLK